MSETKKIEDFSSLTLAIAEIAHQNNKILCDFFGDFSQVDWADAEEEIQISIALGVDNLLDNPEATPSDNHQAWMEHKLSQGWVYGQVKDMEKKTHPCLMAYEDLPPMQQLKDKLFLSTVRTAAAVFEV